MNALKSLAFLSLYASLAVKAAPVSANSVYSFALIQPSCAPWDGGAIEVTLTKEPAKCDRIDGSYLTIGVWKGLPVHAGQEVNFDARSSAGFASQCALAGACERAESGKVFFEIVEQGKQASGHYELMFKGGKTLTGKFDAKWCDKRVMCG